MSASHPSKNLVASKSRVANHTSVAWSAQDEKLQRAIVWINYVAMWLCLIAAALVGTYGHFIVAALFVGFAVVWVADCSRQKKKYAAMLENKPRSMAGLTQWIQLRAWQTDMWCACGAIVHVEDASWFPNPVDAGGGRFSIVCPCGIGYYKLKRDA